MQPWLTHPLAHHASTPSRKPPTASTNNTPPPTAHRTPATCEPTPAGLPPVRTTAAALRCERITCRPPPAAAATPGATPMCQPPHRTAPKPFASPPHPPIRCAAPSKHAAQPPAIVSTFHQAHHGPPALQFPPLHAPPPICHLHTAIDAPQGAACRDGAHTQGRSPARARHSPSAPVPRPRPSHNDPRQPSKVRYRRWGLGGGTGARLLEHGHDDGDVVDGALQVVLRQRPVDEVEGWVAANAK